MSKDPATYLSGPTLFTGLLIEYLLKFNNQVALIFPKSTIDFNNTKNQIYNFDQYKDTFMKISVKQLDFSKVPIEFCTFLLKDSIMEAIDKLGGVDVVSSVYAFPSLIDINDLKKKYRYKTIAFLRGTDVIHGLNPHSYYKKEYPYFKHLRKRYISSINSSDFVSCVSKWLAEYSKKFGVKKINHITYPIVSSKELKNLNYDKNSKLIKKKFLKIINEKENDNDFIIEDDDIILSYAGRLHPDKNIGLVVNIFNEYKKRKYKNYNKLKLIIAGKGQSKSEIQKLINRYKLNKCCRMTFLSYNEVYKLARISFIGFNFGFPTINNKYFYEAAGSNVIVYSSMGTPIIYVDDKRKRICGTSEILSKINLSTMTIQHDDINTMAVNGAKKILYLINNKKIYNKISEKNVEKSKKFYDSRILPDLVNKIIDKYRWGNN